MNWFETGKRTLAAGAALGFGGLVVAACSETVANHPTTPGISAKLGHNVCDQTVVSQASANPREISMSIHFSHNTSSEPYDAKISLSNGAEVIKALRPEADEAQFTALPTDFVKPGQYTVDGSVTYHEAGKGSVVLDCPTQHFIVNK
jgi:hypothetical protein